MELTAQNVQDVFFACMFQDEEVKNLKEGEIPPDAVLAEGVMTKIGFKEARIKEHEADIKNLLSHLPESFFADKGGGYSFLHACMTDKDVQWGEHRNVDQLLTLGLAAKMIDYCMPREMWDALPGGMPYFVVKLPE